MKKEIMGEGILGEQESLRFLFFVKFKLERPFCAEVWQVLSEWKNCGRMKMVAVGG